MIALLKLIHSLRYVSGNIHDIMICLLRFNERLSVKLPKPHNVEACKNTSYMWLATMLILARKDTDVARENRVECAATSRVNLCVYSLA